ncbi:MAG: hypothetical protein ABSE06_12505 [Anaerolineaceae bacterium]|jgi:hypothetical protein
MTTSNKTLEKNRLFIIDKDVPMTVNLFRYTVYDAQSALAVWGTKP